MASGLLNQSFSAATPIASGDPVINTKPNGLVAPLNTLANNYTALVSSYENSSTTLTANTEVIVYADASSNNVTITLPSAASQNAEITIKRLDTSTTYTVTVQVAGADTIEDLGAPALSPSSTTLTLDSFDMSVTLFPYSNKWRVTSSHLNSKYYSCMLYKSTAQSISSGSVTPVTFGSGTEIYDYLNQHSTTTNTERITVLKAGIYQVNAYISFADSTSGGTRGVLLYKNGSTTNYEVFVQQDGTGRGRTDLTANIQLSSGDYIDIRVLQDTGGNLNLNFSALNMMLVA